jgi:hypothetical protein
LGDGRATDSTFSGNDLEIVDSIRGYGYNVKIHKRDGNYNVYNIDGLITQLKSIGVASNKHIPDIYKYASFQQRLDLLRGILDTDGMWIVEVVLNYLYHTNL